MIKRTREIALEFAPIIDRMPGNHKDAHEKTCENDSATISHWRNIWLTNIRKNKETFGNFADHSCGQFWGEAKGRPAIIAGSGPSLKFTAPKLKDRPENMLLISCLHNFHFLEDLEANVDYYVSLDSGPITIEEVTEGGSQPAEYYWEKTKEKKLICFIGTDPALLSEWQGEIYFFNAAIPDETIMKEINDIERFGIHIESGGCVLGTCLFFAKGVLGSQISIFIGSDFSFSQEENSRFHAWDSKYDANHGICLKAVDIFGNATKTWQSYYNFKTWFDLVSERVPGFYINCTEGGILGAYRDGNISSIKQMWWEQMIDLFTLHRHKKEHCLNPSSDAMFSVYI